MSDREDTGTGSTGAGGRPGFLTEDWMATIVGLAILALALLGLIPDGMIW